MKRILFAAVLTLGVAHADEFDFFTLGNLGVGSKFKLNATFILPANTTEIFFGTPVILDRRAGNVMTFACRIDYGTSPRMRRLESGREFEVMEVTESESGTDFDFGGGLGMSCSKSVFSELDRSVDLDNLSVKQLINLGSMSSVPMSVVEARGNLPQVTIIPATPEDYVMVDDSESSEGPAVSGESAADAAAAADPAFAVPA